MRILFIGDIFGRPGRTALAKWLPVFKRERGADFVIANGENAAAGKGVTDKIVREFFKLGVDVVTGGNHSFHVRDSWTMFDNEARLLRPANLPPQTPGHGYGIFDAGKGRKVAVINLQGRAFMRTTTDCPFRTAQDLLDEALKTTPLVFIDFHAEATSEKVGMTHWLDGRVTAVFGTHTHVPTADARITEAGTAAITDVGMTGPYESVIGVDTSIVLDQLIVGLPVRHEVAGGEARVAAVLVEADSATGRALSIEQIIEPGFTNR